MGASRTLHFLFNVVNIYSLFLKRNHKEKVFSPEAAHRSQMSALPPQATPPSVNPPPPPGCLGLQPRVDGVPGPTDGPDVGESHAGRSTR